MKASEDAVSNALVVPDVGVMSASGGGEPLQPIDFDFESDDDPLLH